MDRESTYDRIDARIKLMHTMDGGCTVSPEDAIRLIQKAVGDAYDRRVCSMDAEAVEYAAAIAIRCLDSYEPPVNEVVKELVESVSESPELDPMKYAF